ncbi:MAG: RNA-binding S4 domain-containing protein [Acidimicrobiales bacterium]
MAPGTSTGSPDDPTSSSAEHPHDIAISGEMIRLGQFLKLAGVSDSGSDARRVVATGVVLVNGEVERRRGRQLRRDDVVAVKWTSFRVV